VVRGRGFRIIHQEIVTWAIPQRNRVGHIAEPPSDSAASRRQGTALEEEGAPAAKSANDGASALQYEGRSLRADLAFSRDPRCLAFGVVPSGPPSFRRGSEPEA